MSHIEIIGGVGAGKTTLGKCLAENGFTLVEEEFKANPCPDWNSKSVTPFCRPRQQEMTKKRFNSKGNRIFLN